MKKHLLIVVLFFLLYACDSSDNELVQLPEVNNTNCLYENILKLKHRETREEFLGLCELYKKSEEETSDQQLRSKFYSPSPKVEW